MGKSKADQDRLAQALRENLRKRKEQARERDSTDSLSSVRHPGAGRDPEITSD